MAAAVMTFRSGQEIECASAVARDTRLHPQALPCASSANSSRRSDGSPGEHPGLGGSALAEVEGTPCGICLVVGSRGHEDNPQMLSYKSG